MLYGSPIRVGSCLDATELLQSKAQWKLSKEVLCIPMSSVGKNLFAFSYAFDVIMHLSHNRLVWTVVL